MQRLIRFRIFLFLALAAALIGLFALRLYKVQAAQSDSTYIANDADSITYMTTVEASRGNILDRNGNVLISNRASYNLVIINFVLFNSKTPNESLLRVLELCDEQGIAYQSHFPVTATRPYTLTVDEQSSTWQGYYRAFLANRDYDADISAQTLMKNLMDAYRIPDDWTQEQAYRVISVRYELELRSVSGVGLENYTLATDVQAEQLAAVMELGVPGVIVEASTVREYNTTYAAHLLGSIGQMTAEEYETYKEQGYAMNALVGKDGIEKAFEEYLHGSSGRKFTTVSASGDVLNEYFAELPQPGSNVELTIDLSLQMTAEDALERVILDLRENGVGRKHEGKDAEGGAVVVQEVKTGEILACASYPTFNIATYSQDFNELKDADFDPLYNRALLAEYWPGSIYKMVTAIAAIDYGKLGEFYEVTCKGIYDYYKDQGYEPKCYVWTSSGTTHGTINMQQALQESCNYYFYEVGRLTYYAYVQETGENAMDLVARQLGLGEHTGVELVEYVGTRANAETKAALYSGTDAGWYGADVIQAAIGQSDNKFTPMQLVCYTSALANKGVRYNATFLKRVVSWDYQELIRSHEPTVASHLEMSDEAFDCISTGMQLAASKGTAAQYLSDYPIKVACKTGTAQWGNEYGGSDHASFVLYAPADDPEIAIAVYVEKGAQGGNLANVCIPILNAYFSSSSKYETVLRENTVG